MRRFWWLWVIGGVVVLAVAAVIADVAFRSYAQSEAAAQIEQQLPEAVEGEVSVSIGGGSFLLQLITGEFAEVTLDAPELSVNGVPLAAHAVATGVPTDLTKPVQSIRATASIDQDAVNGIVDIPGDSELVLGDGEVSYEGTISLFGFSLGYQVSGIVAAQGDSVTIEPTTASLTQGAGNLDIDLDQLLGSLADDPIGVCVAQYLPAGAEVESLEITPGRATAVLTADDFVVSEDSLRTLGSC
ncbi:DUF2993 domain-containing protein [Herbiconiux moechotypicola]|uniref:DUF2993 domain-containing protein n=1 Tax=Herbiconiux moechotypicola TaxID=637393 RepID=A0ABN3D7I7_9MICO|nr:DUF2993 domain-containing protein [Herbiconiux moechotypicola]MCS5728421.1 DUF2993 domain-containing protein [Herbiconiux moechotypicola]